MALDSLSIVAKAALNFRVGKASSEIAPGVWALNIAKSSGELSLGTAAGQVDQIFADERTLSATSEESLMLGSEATGGVELTNPAGTAFALDKLAGVLVYNKSAEAVLELFGAGADDPTSVVKATGDAILLRPGAFLLLGVGASDATRYDVTGETVLRVKNTSESASAEYGIVIFGVASAEE